MALVLWAPSAVVAAIVWVLVPGVPARPPFTDPMLHFIVAELLRSVPYVTVFGTAVSVLAIALQKSDGRARRPLQAALVAGAVVPLLFGLWIALTLPLPEGLGSPTPYRLLFCLPVVVGSLFSGAPAVLAAWLLQQPSARRWASGA